MKKFLNYVEIQTKITSFFAFLMTVGYMLFSDITIKPIPTVVFFLSMLIFDLTTTAINNYIDAKGNGADTGYTPDQGKLIIYVLLGLAIILGLALAAMTDLVILACGAVCFGVGILYTWGPVPISRQPYGEIISGVMYGYMIPFIILHSNAPGYLISFAMNGSDILVGFNIWHIVSFLIPFAVPTFLTASIMLANNTCDLEADIKVNRFTLVFYIGKESAVTLMKLFYIGVFGAITVSVIIGALPWLTLLTLVVIPKVMSNYRLYKQDLIKRLSFKYIIMNFKTIMIVLCCLTILGSFI